ncbi:MAG: hypothetical protein RL685_2511 [Pseudomonadota bacterium]|jgi:hypothetical protein
MLGDAHRDDRIGYVIARALLLRPAIVAFLLGAASCRIYRQDSPASAGAAGAATASERSSAPVVARAPREQLAPPATEPAPAQTLSLWVLNRSDDDLVARELGRAGAGSGTSEAPASAVVVLGFGPGQPCAEHFAQRALQLAREDGAPWRALALLLDELRRWRWPEPSDRFAAALKGTTGSFGAVQAVEGATFSADILLSALQQHAVLDGRAPRWLGADAGATQFGPPPAEDAISCASPAGEQLHGPAAVLLLRATGEVFAGLVDREPEQETGLLSIVPQYAVSTAVGSAGGVVLLSGCAAVADSWSASSILDRLGQDDAIPARAGGVDCPLGYALIELGGARVSGTEPLAWARAPQQPTSPPPTFAPDTSRATGDAGASPVTTGESP